MDTISSLIMSNIIERCKMIKELYEMGGISDEQYNEAMEREHDQIDRVNEYMFRKIRASEDAL